MFEKVSRAFAASRGFQIHDPMDPRIHLRNVVRAACLQQNCVTGIR